MNTLAYFEKLLILLEEDKVDAVELTIVETVEQVEAIKRDFKKRKKTDLRSLQREMDDAKLECCELLLRALLLDSLFVAEAKSKKNLNGIIVLASLIVGLEDLYFLYRDVQQMDRK